MSKKQPKLVPALAVVALVVVLAYFVTDVSIWWLLGAGLVAMVFNFLVEIFPRLLSKGPTSATSRGATCAGEARALR